MGRPGQTRQDLTAAEARTLELELAAWEMKKVGSTYRDMGEALGISHVWARALVIRHAARIRAEGEDTDKDMKLLMEEGLLSMRVRFYRNALKGDVEAAKIVLSINKQLAMLRGFGQANRLDLTGHYSQAEIDAIRRELVELLLADAEQCILPGDVLELPPGGLSESP